MMRRLFVRFQWRPDQRLILGLILAGFIVAFAVPVYAFPVEDAFKTNRGEPDPPLGFESWNDVPPVHHPSLTPHVTGELNEPHPIPGYVVGAHADKKVDGYYKQLLELPPQDRIQSKIFNQGAFDRIRKIGVTGFDNMTFEPYRDEAAGDVLARNMSRELDMVRTYQVIPPSLMADAQMKLVSPQPGSGTGKADAPEEPTPAVRRLPFTKEQMDGVMIGAVTKYLKSYKDRYGKMRESVSSGLEFTAFLVSTETGDVVWGARFVGSQRTGLSNLTDGHATWLNKDKFSRSVMKRVLKAFYKRRPPLKQ